MGQDPYKYFRIEGREIVGELTKGAMSLERCSPDPEALARLMRLAHTLKGAARVVNQGVIADLAHKVEDVLSPIRDGAVPGSRETAGKLLELLDAITVRVDGLTPPPSDRKADAPAPSEESFKTLRAGIDEMDALLESVAEVSVHLSAIRRRMGSVEEMHRLSELLVRQTASPIAEDLQGLVAALERDLGSGLEQTERELGQVREAAERLRLLPAGLMFHAVERAVRDAAMSTGKQVAFEARGGDVTMDADMLSVVQRALIQAARNAVAHGIEANASQRTASGKPLEGRVVLEVVRRGNRVSFACKDDGAGVDLGAVRRAALRKGYLSPDSCEVASEDLLRLLMKGGITTTGDVTEVSGRGIGLDVVRETASRLGGTATIQTKPGLGTTTEIVVPVSLSSLDALLVEAAGRLAAIPLDAVRRTLRVTPADVTRSAAGESLVADGNVVPFAPLARIFRQGSSGTPTRRAWPTVIVESQGTLTALGVDRLVGTENVVLRPLPELAPADPCVAGASLDSDGTPRLVLDPAGLLDVIRRTDAPASSAGADRTPILVIDDSLTTRMLEQSILELAGYEVDLATSGEEGLEKAGRRRYALFLVDVEMPGIDGFTFVERTREIPDLARVPAILVTSRNAAEDRLRGKAVGASGYIVKSEFDQTEFLDRIRRLVAQ